MINKKQFQIFLAMTILSSIPSVSNGQACKYAKFSEKHTMCRFSGVGCEIRRGGVTGPEIQTILKLHNNVRQKVATATETKGNQPAASNMNELKWDTELAAIAQRLSDQCKFGADCDDCRRVDRFDVGQNIQSSSTTKTDDNGSPNWEGALESWYRQVANFPSSNISPYRFEKNYSSYTQVAWANTNFVGCGYAQYMSGKWNKKLYICNYGPAGNILEEEMYIKGRACSACPDGTTCSKEYQGLCER